MKALSYITSDKVQGRAMSYDRDFIITVLYQETLSEVSH